jgi:hypothetical protein
MPGAWGVLRSRTQSARGRKQEGRTEAVKSEFVYKPGMRVAIKREDGVGSEFIGTLEDLRVYSLTREIVYRPFDGKKYIIIATRRRIQDGKKQSL